MKGLRPVVDNGRWHFRPLRARVPRQRPLDPRQPSQSCLSGEDDGEGGMVAYGIDRTCDRSGIWACESRHLPYNWGKPRKNPVRIRPWSPKERDHTSHEREERLKWCPFHQMTSELSALSVLPLQMSALLPLKEAKEHSLRVIL